MPRRVDHEQRRRQIIDALLRITVKGGLSAATFRQVAAEAGVSVRLVQYYFGTKAELMHATNLEVAQRMTARVFRRVAKVGDDATPRAVVEAIVKAFLPTDKQSRDAMLVFFAVYTAQMTDTTLARAEAGNVPRGLAALIAAQIRRAHDTGDAPAELDADLEAAIVAAALPGLASAVLVKYLDANAAVRVIDYALDRIFQPAALPARSR